MTVSLIFLSLLMAVFGGWLFSHSVNVRPWEAQAAGAQAGDDGKLPPAATAQRVGLAVFLAVVTSLFALTISAYLMRMEMAPEWQAPPTPGLLWLNTGLLILASAALQWAWMSARRGNQQALRRGLNLGGAFTMAFILGQGLAWRQLSEAGYYLAGNPANSFFFFITVLHALHLLGGLFAWAHTIGRVRQGAGPLEVRVRVELCTFYWHYLLLLWALLFTLLLST